MLSLLRLSLMLGLALATLISSTLSHAAQYHYVEWKTGNPMQGTASGKITLPDDSVVTVQFAAVLENEEYKPQAAPITAIHRRLT